MKAIQILLSAASACLAVVLLFLLINTKNLQYLGPAMTVISVNFAIWAFMANNAARSGGDTAEDGPPKVIHVHHRSATASGSKRFGWLQGGVVLAVAAFGFHRLRRKGREKC